MPPLNKFQKSCIAVAVGQALVPANLQAATITVDTDDTSGGAANTYCDLYDAFQSANTDVQVDGCTPTGSFGADTIVLPVDTEFSLGGEDSHVGLVVNSVITVQGNNSTITRSLGIGGEDFQKRLIDVFPLTLSAGSPGTSPTIPVADPNLTLNNIRLRNGYLNGGGENADDYDGAAVRVTDATLTINNSTLTDNSVTSDGDSFYGGAIFGERSVITLNYVDLEDNSASMAGGAIAIRTSSSLTIDGSHIDDNEAGYFGGAIAAFTRNLLSSDDGDSNTINISRSVITDNSIDRNNSLDFDISAGGAIFSKYGSLAISSTTFEENESGSGNIFIGDGLDAGSNDGNPPIANLPPPSVDDYSNGGAITSKYSALTITDSTFRFNETGLFGGAIRAFVDDVSSVSINRSSFVNNRSLNGSFFDLGAAGSADAGSPDAGLLIPFPGDGQGGEGGAISLYADDNTVNPTTSTIVNSTISGNLAAYGGGIFAQNSPLSLINTTIVGGESFPVPFLDLAASTLSATDTGPSVAAGPLFGALYFGNRAGNAVYAYGENATVSFNNSVLAQPLRDTDPIELQPFAFIGSGGYGLSSFTARSSLCAFGNSASISGRNNSHFEDYSVFGNFTCGGVGGELFDSGGVTVGGEQSARLGRLSSFYGGEGVFAGAGGEELVFEPVQRAHIPLFDSPLLSTSDAATCVSDPVGGVDQRNLEHRESHCDIGAIDARSTIITVNSDADGVDDGVALCTLRDALLSAQVGLANATFSDIRDGSTCPVSYDQTTIQFDPSVFPPNQENSIVLQGGELPAVRDVVSIEGPGSDALILDGDLESRIISLYSGNLFASDVTFTGGAAGDDDPFGGGAIRAKYSDLQLDNTVVTENIAAAGGGYNNGGGIALLFSNAIINDSTISGNYAGSSGGSGGGEGGGINVRKYSYLQLNNSTVVGNRAKYGGDRGPDKYGGGGINVGGESIARIVNSTISGNSAGVGGGLRISDGAIVSYNSTITDNSADKYGGGVYVRGEDEIAIEISGGEFWAFNSIVSGNSADDGGDELAQQEYGIIQIGSSIIGSAESSFASAIEDTADDSYLNFSDGTFFATSTDSSGDPNPDSTPIEDIIGPLAANGGPTLTHKPPSGSPAIDGGEEEFCQGGELGAPPRSSRSGDVPRDQRGRVRNDQACDIGSIEVDDEVFYIIRAANGNVIVFSL